MKYLVGKKIESAAAILQMCASMKEVVVKNVSSQLITSWSVFWTAVLCRQSRRVRCDEGEGVHPRQNRLRSRAQERTFRSDKSAKHEK